MGVCLAEDALSATDKVIPYTYSCFTLAILNLILKAHLQGQHLAQIRLELTTSSLSSITLKTAIESSSKTWTSKTAP